MSLKGLIQMQEATSSCFLSIFLLIFMTSSSGEGGGVRGDLGVSMAGVFQEDTEEFLSLFF